MVVAVAEAEYEAALVRSAKAPDGFTVIEPSFARLARPTNWYVWTAETRIRTPSRIATIVSLLTISRAFRQPLNSF
jgi:hypothetical protein